MTAPLQTAQPAHAHLASRCVSHRSGFMLISIETRSLTGRVTPQIGGVPSVPPLFPPRLPTPANDPVPPCSTMGLLTSQRSPSQSSQLDDGLDLSGRLARTRRRDPLRLPGPSRSSSGQPLTGHPRHVRSIRGLVAVVLFPAQGASWPGVVVQRWVRPFVSIAPPVPSSRRGSLVPFVLLTDASTLKLGSNFPQLALC